MKHSEVKPLNQNYTIQPVNGAIGTVPFIGGLISELIDIAVVPQQQKKLNEWFDFIEVTLN